MSTHYDVVLAGGGVMGCAIATYLLRANPRLRVAIVERDPTYARASTPLSDGNTRIQFNIKENILMSKYALEVLQTFAEDMTVDGDAPDVAFRRQGNLFLANADGYEDAMRGLETQRGLGCKITWLTPDDIRREFPLFDAPGIVGGAFGADDGTMSPMAALVAYKKKAVALGAQFILADVAEVLRDSRRVTGARLANGDILPAKVVVNTAGAWAAQLAATAQVRLPIRPVKRDVAVIEIAEKYERVLPCVFFPSGVYLIHEGHGLFMAGKSLPDDPETTEDFEWSRQRFEERLWPELAELMPAFDRLKILRGWSGLYEMNTLDGNAILGEWPQLEGFYLANGFSGHGFQQCHAVGRYISELILGATPALDLSIFSPRRILENKPVFENARRII